jgi:hypothetical protein
VAPGIDLAAFSSPDAPVVLQVDWTSILVASAVIVTIVAVAVAISSWFALRFDVGRALRIGEE